MIVNLFQLLRFFSIDFLSIIDSFNVFSYSKVLTLIQSRNFVYRIFNFDMYSFVIVIAIDVNRAVLLEKIIPAPGLFKLIAEVPIADPDPTSISVINKFSFYLNFYIFSYNIHYQF